MQFSEKPEIYEARRIFRRDGTFCGEHCSAPNSQEAGALTKKEMVRRIAAELDIDQGLTRKVVQRTLDMILASLVSEGRIELRNFGVFEVRRRAARKARNPRTNEEMIIPPRNVILFQPGKNAAALVERVEPLARRGEKQ